MTLKQIICTMRGHMALLTFAPGKLSLKCALCGRETPGWEIKPPPLRPMTLGVDLAHGKDRSVLVFRRRA